jgi:hypothetical protein
MHSNEKDDIMQKMKFVYRIALSSFRDATNFRTSLEFIYNSKLIRGLRRERSIKRNACVNRASVPTQLTRLKSSCNR